MISPLPEITELDFPEFPETPREHQPALSWEIVMRETLPFREYYRKHHDSPERRLAEKNPESFVLE